MHGRTPFLLLALIATLAVNVHCGGDSTNGDGARPDGDRSSGRRGGGPSGTGGGRGGDEQASAVPIEVTIVARRAISSYIETNGTLEAENEVDIVARTAGPVVELSAEESMTVSKGQRLARLDQDQVRANFEISKVEQQESEVAFERAQAMFDRKLTSREDFEAAKARVDSARARHEADRIQLAYTDIRAPFDGLIVERYVRLAQNVSSGTPLFRLSDFDPLLCRIQVPEKELGRMRTGQEAELTVEAFAGQRFQSRVLRISPVVDGATGTIRVTLAVDGESKLRPGMFASVYLRIDTHDDAVVIPRNALALESIGDTVYVDAGGTAERREVSLGFREGDFVEVLSGLEAGDRLVSLGQDGLSDGTPVQALTTHGGDVDSSTSPARERRRPDGDGAGGDQPGEREGRGPGGRRGMDPSKMTPEQLEFVKQRMKDRGMSEAEIEERMKRMKERAKQDGSEAPTAH